MTKTCVICKEEKEADDTKDSAFAKDKTRPDGFQQKCKLCQKRLSAEHYQKNKDLYLARNTERRVLIRSEVRKLKEASPCTDCKQFYPFWVMQYDHINDDKVLSVSDLAATWMSLRRVLDEIAKCELVCANCHATRTYRRRFSED